MKTSAGRLALASALLINVVIPGVYAADQDPATAPLPDMLDVLLDSRRAIYVEFALSTDGTTEILDQGVSNVPPAAADDEPALLLIEWLDARGDVMDRQNAWDPRYELYIQEEDHDDELLVVERGVGAFQATFNHRIAGVRILDQQQDPNVLLAEVRLQQLVEDFCTDNPGDANCVGFVPADLDADGVPDLGDACPGTSIPESVPVSGALGANRWALLGGGGVFTQAPPREGATYGFTIIDTRGCSCGQIVQRAGLGAGNSEFGCPTGVMLDWVSGALVPTVP